MTNTLTARRVALWLWLSLCTGVLVFAFVQRAIHVMPFAAFWFVALLAFPSGLVGAAFAGYVSSELSRAWNIPYEPFFSFLPIWGAAVALGYLQWFVLMPWLARRAWNHLTRRSSGRACGAPLS